MGFVGSIWEFACRVASVYRSVPVVIGAALNFGAVIGFLTTGHRSWLALALAGALCIIVAFFVASYRREKDHERLQRELQAARSEPPVQRVVHEQALPFVADEFAREQIREQARQSVRRPDC